MMFVSLSSLLLVTMPCDAAFTVLHTRQQYQQHRHHPTASVPNENFGMVQNRQTMTILHMGKGLNKKRNKQAELAKKMAEAKEQARLKAGQSSDPVERASARLSDEEIQKRNDMQRFEDLLNSSMTDYEGEGYLSKAQEEEEANAGYAGVDRIYEGDPAPTTPFENLVSIVSENALGKDGASRLVPWLHKSATRHKDYLIIVTDPRMKSSELRQTMKMLEDSLSEEILKRLIVVNADSPSENRRWLKKNSLSNIRIYSDEKMEFMRDYTALGKNRWAMCMFIIVDGRVQKLVRELDVEISPKVVQNAVKSLRI